MIGVPPSERLPKQCPGTEFARMPRLDRAGGRNSDKPLTFPFDNNHDDTSLHYIQWALLLQEQLKTVVSEQREMEARCTLLQKRNQALMVQLRGAGRVPDALEGDRVADAPTLIPQSPDMLSTRKLEVLATFLNE